MTKAKAKPAKVPLPNGIEWNLVVCAASPGGALYPSATSQENSVQVFTAQPATWVGRHSGDGESFYLMQAGQYLSAISVPLPYKNNCLIMTADAAQAARLVPYAFGDLCYLHLKGTKNCFTLDTRGYVTLFEAQQKVNDYPWFQYFDFAQIFPPVPSGAG